MEISIFTSVNHAKVQSKTNKYCKFHVDLTRRRLSKSRFKKLGMVPKKLYRNTLSRVDRVVMLLAMKTVKRHCLFSIRILLFKCQMSIVRVLLLPSQRVFGIKKRGSEVLK